MENRKVKNVVISKQPENSTNFEKFLKIVKEKNINVKVVNKGDKIWIEKKLYFHVLWPDESNFIQENPLNNNALVCMLYYQKFSCLFTGDIEEVAEKEMIQLYADTNLLKADILKVAHHGSKTSSSQEFLELIKPKIALIGVGKNNLFGHPNSEVLTRLNDRRVKIYRTDEDGEITVMVNRKGKVTLEKFIN